ncbi:MAG: diguanylate cyclase [Campylobacteraceae bacterium]|nr:diguanylate cyclase [Campylobacteraceae bacterium]
MSKLLIVEDNKSLAKMLSIHISKTSGYAVVVAHSMSEAIAAVQKESFLAALLDLNLPDAPNGEVVDEIIARGIPAIVLTGNLDENTKKLILQKPIVDYVYKEKFKDIDYIISKIERLEKNKNQKVLVVDDSSVVRNEIKNYLSRELYQIFAVGNGEEALNFYKDNPDISLIITDMNMPIMDGLELVEELRKITTKETLSIIGISGDSETAVKFLKMGANDFIRKPFTKEEFVCRINNAVEALENIQQIKQVSITDFLTGVYNRRYFFEQFEEYYKEAVELGTHFALATFDIDNFKKINDTYGHPAGDEAIKMVANAIKSRVKGTDIVARLGGEEFVLLLKSVSADDALMVVDSIRSEIARSELKLKNGDTIFLTVSIGVATRPYNSLEEMMDASDALLYKAKTNGKNQTVTD